MALVDDWELLTESVPPTRVDRWRNGNTGLGGVPKFEAIMNGRLQLAEDLQAQPLREIEEQLLIDRADGVWLDFLGARLGLQRPTTQVPRTYFGFGPAIDPANAPTPAVPPVQRAGFNQAPFFTARDLGGHAVEAISDVVYRQCLRARRVTRLTKWCVKPDIERSARYAAGIHDSVQGAFMLDPSAPQIAYAGDEAFATSTPDTRAVAMDLQQESILLVAVGESATESRLWRVQLSPFTKTDRGTLPGVARAMAPSSAQAVWMVLGATLHSYDHGTRMLDAGTAITGLGAGETVRAMITSPTGAWLHTGRRLYSLDTGTGAATSVGAAITGTDDQVETLAIADAVAYATRGDGRFATLDTGTGVLTDTGESLPAFGVASAGLSYANNEGDARTCVLDSDGTLHFYDAEIAAARLRYALYVGGAQSRLIRQLLIAADDPTEPGVQSLIVPRPAGVGCDYRII